MDHLSPETLARLVDEAPSPEERLHLAACAACAAELRALREQTEALADLPDLRPPVGDWEVLQARLVSEGLVRRRTGVADGLAVTPGWMRAAAAVLLFVGGTVVGAGVARQGVGAGPDPAGPVASAGALALVSTSEEAAELVRAAERTYMDALLRYQQLAEAEGRDDTPADPASRYAALEYLVAAGQAAVRQAPADPFLNGLLVSAMAERQSVLRRISSGRPDDWF